MSGLFCITQTHCVSPASSATFGFWSSASCENWDSRRCCSVSCALEAELIGTYQTMHSDCFFRNVATCTLLCEVALGASQATRVVLDQSRLGYVPLSDTNNCGLGFGRIGQLSSLNHLLILNHRNRLISGAVSKPIPRLHGPSLSGDNSVR